MNENVCLTILIILLFTGCSIESWQLNGALEECKDNGGIYLISPKIGLANFHCGNGKVFIIERAG